MNHLPVYALFAVLGVFTAGVAFAQDQGAGGGRRGREQARAGVGGRGGAGLALRGVTLTDAQQQQVRVLTEQHREQNRASAERLRVALDAQRQAADANPVNEQAIRIAAREVADAQAEVLIAQAKLRSAVLALLMPEQRAQAEQASSERGGRRAVRPSCGPGTKDQGRTRDPGRTKHYDPRTEDQSDGSGTLAVHDANDAGSGAGIHTADVGRRS